jgi:hypothetical protein
MFIFLKNKKKEKKKKKKRRKNAMWKKRRRKNISPLYFKKASIGVGMNFRLALNSFPTSR